MKNRSKVSEHVEEKFENYQFQESISKNERTGSKSREENICPKLDLNNSLDYYSIISNYRRYYFNENFAIFGSATLFDVSKNKIEEAFGNCARGFINLVSREARRSRIIFRNQRG